MLDFMYYFISTERRCEGRSRKPDNTFLSLGHGNDDEQATHLHLPLDTLLEQGIAHAEQMHPGQGGAQLLSREQMC